MEADEAPGVVRDAEREDVVAGGLGPHGAGDVYLDGLADGVAADGGDERAGVGGAVVPRQTGLGPGVEGDALVGKGGGRGVHLEGHEPQSGAQRVGEAGDVELEEADAAEARVEGGVVFGDELGARAEVGVGVAAAVADIGVGDGREAAGGLGAADAEEIDVR